MKQFPGIRLEYSIDDRGEGKYVCRFNVILDKKVPVNTIAYSRTKKHVKEPVGKAGKINLGFDVKTKTATWIHYYPYSNTRRIANRTELRVIKEMKRLFPSLERFDGAHKVDGWRANQLMKRDMSNINEYSYKEAVEKLTAKIRRDNQKTTEKFKVKTIRIKKRKPKFRRVKRAA